MKKKGYGLQWASLLLAVLAILFVWLPALGESIPLLTEKTDLSVGDTVLFGAYQQSDSNTPEPIAWLVVDKTPTEALLVSRYCLDTEKFWNNTTRDWERSDLRRWMNERFYAQAFTSDEKLRVIPTMHNDAKDYVFCLSKEEAQQYLQPLGAMGAPPTLYAQLNGARLNKVCYWWTRSPGRTPDKCVTVSEQGKLTDIDGSMHYVSVRPAIRISLKQNSTVSLEGVWQNKSYDGLGLIEIYNGLAMLIDQNGDDLKMQMGTSTINGNEVVVTIAQISLPMTYNAHDDLLDADYMQLSRAEDQQGMLSRIKHCDNWYYEVLPDQTAKLWMYTGDAGAFITVPAQLDGYPVSSLGSNLFASNQEIAQVILPDTVKTIGTYAFASCNSLMNVQMPGVVEIGDSAFHNCNQLVSISLPQQLKTIGSNAFSNTGLMMVMLPNSLQKIGSNAFASCYNMAVAIFGNGLEIIDDYAFESTGLTNVIFNEGIKSIGEGAFSYCDNLQIVKLPDSLETLGVRAFAHCPSLITAQVPEGLDITSAFDKKVLDAIEQERLAVLAPLPDPMFDYTVLEDDTVRIDKYKGTETRVVIPATIHGRKVIEIGEHAFSKSAIEHVEISEGIERIGFEAFYYCQLLQTAVLPSSVQDIGERAFVFCYKLESIVIPHNVTVLRKGTFMQCGLTSVTLHDGIVEIGANVFASCGGITDIALPAQLQKIGQEAFSGTGITQLRLPETLTSLGSNAFLNCAKLTSVYIPSGISHIPDRCFSGCSKITDLQLSEGLKSIGWQAFAGNWALTSLQLPSTLESIGDGAFSSCNAIAELVLPEGLRYIGTEAFTTRKVSQLLIPAQTQLADNAFNTQSGMVLDVSLNADAAAWALRHGMPSVGSTRPEIDVNEVLRQGSWLCYYERTGETLFYVFGDTSKGYLGYAGGLARGTIKGDAEKTWYHRTGDYKISSNKINCSLSDHSRREVTIIFDDSGMPIQLYDGGFYYDHVLDRRVATDVFPDSQ